MRASMAHENPSIEASIDGICAIDRGMARAVVVQTGRGAAPSSVRRRPSSSSTVVAGDDGDWRLCVAVALDARVVAAAAAVACAGWSFARWPFERLHRRRASSRLVARRRRRRLALYIARCCNTMRLHAIALVVLGRDRLAIHARFHARIGVERRGVRRHRGRVQRRRGGSIGGGRPLAHGGPVGFDVRHRGVDVSRERGEREEREGEGGAGRH